VSNTLLSAAWLAQCRSPAAKLVLVRLADMADGNGTCWPSVAKLIRDCNLGERTVQRAIKSCVRSGHIEVEPTPRSSIYRVHPRQNDTPAKLAPVPKTTRPPSNTTRTPAKLAPKPSGTIREPSENPQGNGISPSAGKPSLKEMFAEALAKELNNEA
jgi:DNA-binding transcriptional MocR family regulator